MTRRGGEPAGEPSAATWYSIRHVRSFKPVSYTCPLCREQLHAMSDHVLIAPEGDTTRRRHAHPVCVRDARAAGRLPTRDEWERAQPKRAGRLGRLLGRSPADS